MSSPNIPLPAFAVAVVGSSVVMTEDELATLLDLLVNRHRGERQIILLSPSRSPAATWARGNGYSIQLVPDCGNATKQDCEFCAYADAVVVLGDPGPWRLLIWLCETAGIPVRVFMTKPPMKIPSPNDWELL